MTDDIKNYRFNFVKEAEDLRTRLGPAADNIIFSQTMIAPPENEGEEPRLGALPVGDTQFMNEYWRETFNLILKNYNGKSEAAVLSRGNIDIGHRVSIVENENAVETLGEENRDLMRLWILYHETAHALIPGRHAVDNNHPFREAAADAYAALRFIQRFGPEANDFIAMVSWRRALRVIHGDTSHMTTIVLNKISADSARDDFSKLSPAETVKLAETYAKKWTPKIKTLSATRSFFKQRKSLGYSDLMRTCLASPSAFTFCIGAEFFQPFLRREGLVLNGQTLQLPEAARLELAAATQQRAASTRLCHIINTVAAKKPEADIPLTALLKLPRPKGGKPFTANL